MNLKMKLKKNKNKIGLIAVIFIFLMLFFETTSFNQKSLNLETQSEFSDKLKHETYDSLEQLDGWHDGVETFMHDDLLANPKSWTAPSEPTGINIRVNDKLGHSNTLEMIDTSGSNSAFIKHYFLGTLTGIGIEFYALVDRTTAGNAFYYNFYNSDGTRVVRIYFMAGTIYIIEPDGDSHVLQGYTANTWYRIRISLNWYDTMIYVKRQLVVEINDIVRYQKDESVEASIGNIGNFEAMALQTPSGGIGQMYLDALGYYEIIWSSGNIDFYRFKSQIRNIDYYKNLNQVGFTTDDYFSFFETIIDKYPNFDNNYRTWFITDNIMNIKYLDDNRLLRLRGSDNTQNKYKVIQMYFDDLEKNESFSENISQFVGFRVDSFDNAENLINMFYFNLTFNQSHGMITWNVLYRESLAVPKWHNTPTNPIFDFSDYLEEGETLETLQVNCHFFLTYNSTHRLMIIRTEVSFNNRFDQIYVYDKIINAGSGAFYNTQSKIKVEYIDYFNYNNGTDYLENNFYTYNNLRGLRTLKTNNTDYCFNFLDAGFFTDNINFPLPPPPTPPPEGDDPEDDDLPIPDKEEGDYDFYLPYYWYYLEYNTETEYDIGDDSNPLIPADSGIKNWNMGYSTIRSRSEVRQFGFEEETVDYIEKSDLDDWELKIDMGLGEFKWNFNWFRNGVIMFFNFFIVIINYVLLALQFVVYALFAMFSFLIMGLLLGIVGVFFWNFPILWIWLLLMMAGWCIYAAFAIVIYWVIWLWEEIIVPFMIWCYEFLLPLLLALFIELWAIIIAIIITLLAGETIGGAFYNNVLDNTRDMLLQTSYFLFDSIDICIENIDAVVYSIFLYILFIGLCYLKYWYNDAKGNLARAEELKASYDAYVLPFRIILNLYDRVKNSIPMA